MTHDLAIHWLIPESISDHSRGRQLFAMIGEISPSLYPEKYGNYEPINKEVDPGNLERMLELWSGTTFFWKRKKPAAFGSAFMGNARAHDGITVTAMLRQQDTTGLATLVKAVASAFSSDLAYLHYSSPHEQEQVPYDMRHPMSLGVSTFDLQKNIPNLPWATVFGKPYVDLFGRDQLLSCPAAVVEELGEGLVYVQLMPSLSDVEKDFDGLQEARRRVKKHLGENAFMRDESARLPVEPASSHQELQAQLAVKTAAGGPYRVPAFRLRD